MWIRGKKTALDTLAALISLESHDGQLLLLQINS